MYVCIEQKMGWLKKRLREGKKVSGCGLWAPFDKLRERHFILLTSDFRLPTFPAHLKLVTQAGEYANGVRFIGN